MSEREAIVAFVRRYAPALEGRAGYDYSNATEAALNNLFDLVRAETANIIANAIERGEHKKDKTDEG
jgi:hypothetical protein